MTYDEAIKMITLARRSFMAEHGYTPTRIAMNKKMRDLLVEGYKTMKVVGYNDTEREQVCGMDVELSDLPDGRFIVSGGKPI